MGDSPSSGNAANDRTPCARIESEIATASERLRATAQNFSLEWKSFLSYAMKMKASTTSASPVSGGDGGGAAEQRELEDLLLHSQSGLVMLREMQTRRGRKWKEVRERYGYEHPSLESTASSADSDTSDFRSPRPQTPSSAFTTNGLLKRLVVTNREIADAARVVLLTQRLDLPFAIESPHSIASILCVVSSDDQQTHLHNDVGAQYVLVKVRTRAIATASKFERVKRHRREDMRPDQAPSESVEPGDVEELLEVTFERRQLQIALGRFFTRMRWLCTSHRYHLRHRMLALVHQYRQKIGALAQRKTGEAATTSSTSDGQSCPLLLAQTKQSVEADLEVLLRAEHSLSIPRGKRNEVDNFALKQTIDELFSRGLEDTAIDRQPTSGKSYIGEDGGQTTGTDLDDSVTTRLAVECLTWSRWDLLQMPYYLGSPVNDVKQTARGQRGATIPIHAAEDDRSVDAMLKNEWRLLQLDDVAYMRARLESLASNHEQRATIAIHVHEPGSLAATPCAVSSVRPSTSDVHRPLTSVPATQSAIEGSSRSPKSTDWSKAGSSTTADPLKAMLPTATNVMSESSTALYSLYALRVLSCRTQRRRLLRLLNYAHYLLHVARQASATDTTVDSQRSQQQARQQETASAVAQNWKISVRSSGEYVVSQELTRRDDNSEEGKPEQKEEKSSVSESKEFIFDGAQQDLKVLERQMMRIGSHFIRKQEYSHFRRYEDPAETATVVPTIDRLQVLHDLFECQITFQRAKLQLVELLLGNGLLGHLGAGVERSGLRIITSVLQYRPHIDFTHDYFVESFASETIQLELQIRLQQQLRDHLLTASKARSNREKGSNLRLGDGRERRARLVLAHHSQSAKSVAHFWCLQEKLLDEAETKWFNATSVTEWHALRQSVYEQLLVIWQLITKFEIPAAPVHVLERSAVDILTGSGLQVVLPPSLLIDTSRQLYARAQTSAHNDSDVPASFLPERPLFEWLAAAWWLLEWHQLLAHSVYEAGLLDRVYRFQYGFVREMERANEQARLFFFDAAGACTAGGSGSDPTARDGHIDCDSMTSTLMPIAIQLGLADAGASEAQSAHLDNIHKTVPNWVEHQLWTAMMEQERSADADNADVEYPVLVDRGNAALLRLQRQWVEYLGVRVDFHDRVGAHVFEFASSSSFTALEAMRQQQRPSKQGNATFTDVDIDMVRVKYASDVAHKMAEEMQRRCYPYWMCLDMFKQRLHSQYAVNYSSGSAAARHDDNNTSESAVMVTTTEDKELERIEQLDHAGVVVRVESTDACCRFLSDAAAVPRLLAQLDELLQRLRNEAQLMLSLGCDAHAMCAFLLPVDDGGGEEGDHNPNSLEKWFVSKFDQLKNDLQVHDKPTSTTSTADNVTCQSGTHRFVHNTTADNDNEDEGGDDNDGSDPRELLLRSVPSFSLLLRQFISSRHAPVSKPGHTMHTSQSGHAPPREDGVAGTTTLGQQQQEAAMTALRELVTVYSALVQLVEMCHVQCALLGGVGYQHRAFTQVPAEDHEGLRIYRANRGALSDPSPPPHGDETGRKLLTLWQCRFHDHVRKRLRKMAGRIISQVCTASLEQDGKTSTKQTLQPLALFAGPVLEEDAHRAHASLTLRLEVESVAHQFLEQERELIRFVLAAAAMQTFADGLEGRRRRSLLLEIDAIVTAGVGHLRICKIRDYCSNLDASSHPLDAIDRLREALHRFPLFGLQERPPQRQLQQQSELQRLWDAVIGADLQPRPPLTQMVLGQTSIVAILAQLLRLQRVFIEEHIDRRAPLQDPSTMSATAQSNSSYPNAEARALRSLAGAWESYHAIGLALSNGESLDDDMFARLYQQPSTKVHGRDSRSLPHNTPGLVSGNSFRLKTRLLGDGGSGDAERSGTGDWNVTRWIALECLTLGQQTYAQVADPAASVTTEKGLILPSEVRSREYVRWLHSALELAWIHRDMEDMQAHYDTLLQYRKQHQEHRSKMSPVDTHTWTGSPPKPPTLSILQLASFFIESVPDTNCEPACNGTAQSGVLLVPSNPTANQLRQQELVGAYESSLMIAFQQCEELEKDVCHLRCRLRETESNADVKREAHAVDYAYALHFKMQALHQQLDLVHRRVESERAAVRCELSDEYADKLQSLRVQLLAAGAQFDDFRMQLQSQLMRQLQLAQTHVIEQLVDGGEPGAVSAMVSASLSVPAKAALLASLPAKQQQTGSVNGGVTSSGGSSSASADTVTRLERENAALKRSILRLQALVTVQQQVQVGARDRELEMTRRHAASDALSRHELNQLRAQMAQLESDVSRLAQEKARAQLRAARLEQERDQIAQRRREAKARALSAPYYRRAMADRHNNLDNSRLGDFKGDDTYRRDRLEVLKYNNVFTVDGEIKQDATATAGVSENDSCMGRRQLAVSSAPAVTAGRHAFSVHGGNGPSRSAGMDWEEMEEAFEAANERAVRSPIIGRAIEDDEEPVRSLAERYQRSMQHQQNEIRRLQQQLSRESKLKAAALRQLADMKAAVHGGDQQDGAAVEGLDNDIHPSIEIHRGDTTPESSAPATPRHQQVRPAIPPSPRRVQSAAPCAPMHHRVLASSTGAPLPSTPKRPSTSFSPRASFLSSSSLTQAQSRAIGSPAAPSPRQDPARPPSARGKFHVVKPERSSLVGGVAGIPTALSAREPLPYR